VTAGNSSQVSDGAGAVLIAEEKTARSLGLMSRAAITHFAVSGDDLILMLTGIMPATRKLLGRAGIGIGDIDAFEVNEAFASVVLRFLQAFNIDPAKVNVNGGAIALGHPLGATGAMLVGTVVDELERTGKQTALVTLCIGAGMGTATIIERV
jgi:acetyl-CoA C-acetyltransferase